MVQLTEAGRWPGAAAIQLIGYQIILLLHTPGGVFRRWFWYTEFINGCYYVGHSIYKISLLILHRYKGLDFLAFSYYRQEWISLSSERTYLHATLENRTFFST
jgi:hypothetical protein